MPLFNYNDIVAKASTAPTFKQLEEGDYNFVISDMPEVDNERLQVKARPRVVDGERKNASVFLDLNFDTGKPDWQLRDTVSTLEAMGLTPEQLNSAQSLEQIAQMVFGKQFAATVKHSPNKNDPSKFYVNLRNARPSSNTVGLAGPAGPNAGPGTFGGGPGATPPAAPQAAPQQNFQTQAPAAPQQFQQEQPQAPQAPAQQNPWDEAPQGQPQAAPQPTTNFTPPPRPFG